MHYPRMQTCYLDLETVAIKLVAHRENGEALTRLIEIDTLTRQIREQTQESIFGSSFYDVLEKNPGNNEIKAETLAE